MILDRLTDMDRYATLHPRFARAIAYLRETNLAALAPGRYAIDGDALKAIVEETHGRSRADARLESHRRYIDLQLVLSGEESMGWRALNECQAPLADYAEEKDIRFYADAPASWIAVPPGNFCIFFPSDAHAPLVGEGPIRKLILKIAVD